VGLCEVDLKVLTDSVEKLGGGSFGRRWSATTRGAVAQFLSL
jgi:hypothetical protein